MIADDCSNDSSHQIINSFVKKYPKIFFYIKRSRNLGQYTGRNGRLNGLHAYSLVKSKYIAVCDGDDYWTDPYKLQKQVDYLEANPDCSICTHWVDQKIEDKNSIVIDSPRYNGFHQTVFFDRKSVFQKDMVIAFHASSFVFRRSCIPLITKMPTSIATGDTWVTLACLTKGHGYCIQESMSVYRVHNTSTWTPSSTYRRFLNSLHFLLRLSWSFPIQYGKFAFKKFLFSFNKISLSDFVSVNPIDYQKSNNEIKSKDPVFFSVIYIILTIKIFWETLQNRISKFRIFIGQKI